MRYLIALSMVGMVVTASNGCGPRPETNSEDVQPATGFLIVVGDATASDVLQRLADNGIRTSSTLDDQADSSLLIVVQDSTVGPLPIHLEIAKSLEVRPAGDYLWLFTNTALIGDQELLELEELECRELFNSQGLPGDSVPIAFDSPPAPGAADSHGLRGWEEILSYIRRSVN